MLNQTEYGKICGVCGKGFSTIHASKLYCSMDCTERKRRAYQDAEPTRIKIALLEAINAEANEDMLNGNPVAAHARVIEYHLATLKGKT